MAKRKVIYLSGPITGVERYWEPFERVADGVRAKGHIAISPTMHPQGLTNEQYMRLCLAQIDVADAVLFLDGWACSRGSVVEWYYAHYIDKTMLYKLDELEAIPWEVTR